MSDAIDYSRSRLADAAAIDEIDAKLVVALNILQWPCRTTYE